MPQPVAPKHLRDDVIANAAKIAHAPDPKLLLRDVRSMQDAMEELEAIGVDAAVDRGVSWAEIARALGKTRQTVHRKHARRRARPKE